MNQPSNKAKQQGTKTVK